MVGGGASGMMAAYAAAKEGASVTLFEKNEKLGKKIYITGKGRCNVTNLAADEAFFANLPRNARFMFSAYSAFDQVALMQLIEENGTPLKTERGQRVFPVSDKASDITKALQRALQKEGVKVCLQSPVKGLWMEEDVLQGILLEGEKKAFDAVILCCGGLSYSSTGSTGDGLRFAKETGHTLVSPLPSLIPLETVEDWPAHLQGLSLRNVTLTAYRGKKVLYQEMGELLFTHFGLSGPLTLSASSHIAGLPLESILLEVDMKPALKDEVLDQRLQRELVQGHNKQLLHILPALVPSRMAQVVLNLAGIPPLQVANSVTREMRRSLLHVLKHLPLHVKALRPIEEAIIMRGGVSVKNINPSTMESKIVPHLYFAGESLDVDGYTGGFNLQIAFSTGYLAGKMAAQER